MSYLYTQRHGKHDNLHVPGRQKKPSQALRTQKELGKRQQPSLGEKRIGNLLKGLGSPKPNAQESGLRKEETM